MFEVNIAQISPIKTENPTRRKAVPILSALRARPIARERFLQRLRKEGDCLVFTGTKNARGYGFVDITGTNGERHAILTHRLAWVLANGEEVPEDALVCHRCNNPSCCNAEHLYLGTHQTNADDRVQAGNSCKGEKSPLYMIRGVNHPRATYDQATRDRVIALRREAKSCVDIEELTGVPTQTVSRWWNEWLRDGKI